MSSTTTTTTTTTTTLLLVDVQKDFHPGGSLAIPTADKDAERIVALIERNGDKIDRIVATMDTHQKLHIANPTFWYDGTSMQKHPDPFTIISANDIANGVWKPRPDLCIPPESLDRTIFGDENITSSASDNSHSSGSTFDLTKYCLDYATRLESAGRFQLCIWPEHCLIGSVGHGMVDSVLEAVQRWSDKTGRSVEWVHKGQNILTEMYSALAAEVPVTQETSYNKQLLASLAGTSSGNNKNKLLVCGQAMSHCVNYTVRDIVQEWPTDRVSDIYLLTDCASAVPGFETAAETFQTDMRQAGIQLIKSTTINDVEGLF